MAIKLPSITSHSRFNGFRSAALVANGSIQDYPLMASLIKEYDFCIAVDGGLLHCHEMQIRPDLILGDFDSVSKELLLKYEGIQTEAFPVNKNESDTELALEAVMSPNVEKIGLFGALEKRTDHTLYNLYLLQRFHSKVVIETDCETICVITETKEIPCTPGQTISLIPLGSPASGVTTQGLKWELVNAQVDSRFMSLSNICLKSSFSISIEHGSLICCINRMII